MADKKSDEGEWRLAGESGELVVLDDWELVGGLSSGEIRADAWVWKRGWGEWLRASEIEALRSALPEAERAPVKQPRLGPADSSPPSVPSTTSKGDSVAVFPTPIPYTPSPATLPRISHMAQRGEGLFRSPEPTLVDRVETELDGVGRTTLKPPGAVPPPPRGVPKPSPARQRLDTPIPETAETSNLAVGDDTVAETERDEGPPPTTDANDTIQESEPAWAQSMERSSAEGGGKQAIGHEPKVSKPHRLSDRPEHSLDATLPAASGFSDAEKTPTTRRLLWAIAGLGVLCVVLLGTIVVLLLSRQDEGSALFAPSSTSAAKPSRGKPEAMASAAAPASGSPANAGCGFVSDARLLASTAVLSVPVAALSLDAATIAVGFAASPTHAIGLKVSWPKLDVETVFEKQEGPALVGVIPTNANGELGFVTDRASGPLKSVHSLNTAPRISVGAVAAGLGQWTRGLKPRVVWSGGGTEPITVPRSASSRHHGIAVTFRRGRRKGEVLLGWLSERGKPNSELAAIGKPGQLSGTPSVATNEAQVLVSFANRDDPQAPWQIVAGTAPLGEVPKQAAPLAGLPVADGAAAISPAVVGLHGGGWLLQWTEGSGSAYRVRLQVLNQQLEPVSTTLEASPKGQNSGQGAVWADGERALSLFIVSRGNEKELWARSLRCR